MGSITRSFANNIGTSGILKAGAFNNASLNNVTALNAAIATGNMVLISSQTASASASISFTTGIDSTYKEYQFWFINIHPSTLAEFQFNLSTDSGSNYNVTKTTTAFQAYHNEAGNDSILEYVPSADLAQSTAFQALANNVMADADAHVSGTLQLFNPASTTYVKHFIVDNNNYRNNSYSWRNLVAGYGNTTSAVNAIQFKFSSGNIDDGTILMYGIK
jgi:hypothetical protein